MNNDNYFLSETHRIAFALIYLSGEQQADILGITPEMYRYQSLADNWHTPLLCRLTIDLPNHPDIVKALSALDDLHASMVNAYSNDEEE